MEWLRMHPKPEEESEIAKLQKQNDALMKRLEALEKSKAAAPSKAMRAKMAAFEGEEGDEAAGSEG